MNSDCIVSLFNRSMPSGQTFHNFIYWPFVFVTWIPAAVFFNDHVGNVTWITGASMYPLLNSNFNENLKPTICWMRKWQPTKDLERGMIVTFRSPNNPENHAVKRVLAKEGDSVITRSPCPVPTIRVPLNHIWVEGDNGDPNKTLDSNTYGPIPLNLVDGRVTHILSPWRRFGPIQWQEYKGRKRVIRGQRDDAPRW